MTAVNIDAEQSRCLATDISFWYDEFTIEVQQMIKKKTHSLSPCKI